MPPTSDPKHALTRHGHAAYGNQSPLYRRWADMLTRCRNPKAKSYPRYGGRGIKVCERWTAFRNFLADMGEPPTPEHQLERIDNEGDYEPGNCRWATRREQANNRRSSRRLTHGGRTQTVTRWAEEVGMAPATLYRRVFDYGWPVEEALKTPTRGWAPGRPKSAT